MERVRRDIDLGARLTQPYLVMNALATIVAAYGLLANSTAVVIGAMIIAMLLGPIMGLALGLVDGDVPLLRRAIMAELVGALLVVLIASILGRVHADIPIQAEILSRTKANLLDLLIAIGGGAAGAYATASPRISVGLVGVAISTALVPPLATCGICLARGLPNLATGAFALFFTNLVAIQCASSAVLFAMGFHRVTERKESDRVFFGRLALDAVILTALALTLYRQLAMTVQQQQFEETVKYNLREGLRDVPGAFLSETRFLQTKTSDIVVAVVRVPNSITPEQTAVLQASLPTRTPRHTELHVRSLFTKETTVEGYLHVIEPTALPIEHVSTPTEDPSTIDRSGTITPSGVSDSVRPLGR